MSTPKISTIKRLFTVSKNLCAFPSCTNNIIDKETGKVLGEICHIKAQNTNGPRYDEEQTQEERHGYDNLILLCPIHHTIIDSDLVSFTSERLLSMKISHETEGEDKEEINEDIAQQLIQNITNTNITIDESNKVKAINTIGGQFAKTIQNITSPISIKEEIEYDDLLPMVHDSSVPLSKVLAQTIKVARNKSDVDLVNLCIAELSGWERNSQLDGSHRIVEVFVSPHRISRVNGLSTSELWNDLSQKESFVKKDMFFEYAVSQMEQKVKNSGEDLNFTYIHFQQNQSDMFPDINLPNIKINIYARGTLYVDLLSSVRNNLSKEILKRM